MLWSVAVRAACACSVEYPKDVKVDTSSSRKLTPPPVVAGEVPELRGGSLKSGSSMCSNTQAMAICARRRCVYLILDIKMKLNSKWAYSVNIIKHIYSFLFKSDQISTSQHSTYSTAHTAQHNTSHHSTAHHSTAHTAHHITSQPTTPTTSQPALTTSHHITSHHSTAHHITQPASPHLSPRVLSRQRRPLRAVLGEAHGHQLLHDLVAGLLGQCCCYCCCSLLEGRGRGGGGFWHCDFSLLQHSMA
jgi:hypothetical protein